MLVMAARTRNPMAYTPYWLGVTSRAMTMPDRTDRSRAEPAFSRLHLRLPRTFLLSWPSGSS